MFSAGIYARLSVDGQGRKNESIETQIEIASAYLEQQENIVLYDCYTDIGRSGTDFDRPGFQRLMQDVRLRRVNCIIVKDLSRFGRNHIETGNFLEKIFPFLGVRFVAVADRLDTWHSSTGNVSMGIHLKNLMNEMYARDIGLKVHSSKQVRRKEGSYTGGVPPYGYSAERKAGKRYLIPEAMTADVVKSIYEQFRKGRSVKEIRRWLYEEGIHSPRDYRIYGQVYSQRKGDLREWPAATIRSLLKNPVYIPILDQGAFDETISRFGKEEADRACARENPKDSDRQVAEIQEFFGPILFCGDCGRKLSRTSTVRETVRGKPERRYYYSCPASYRIDAFRCEKKSISGNTLTFVLLSVIQQVLFSSGFSACSLAALMQGEMLDRRREAEEQLYGIERSLDGIRIKSSQWYAGYRLGKMSRECYMKRWQEEDSRIRELQNRQEGIKRRLGKMAMAMEDWMAFLQICDTDIFCGGEEGWRTMTEKQKLLLRETVGSMIGRIEVYSGQYLKVSVRFRKGEEN